MKNVALFVVLAVLTVAALVAWNVTSRKTTPQPIAVVQPTPSVSITPTPTPETGGALRRIFNGGLFGGGNTTPTPTTTLSTTGSTLGTIASTITPMPTVTVGPTPVGGLTKGGVTLGYVNPTVTPASTSIPQPTFTPQAANVISFRDSGFAPDSIVVKQGTVVRFINDSNQNMWIVADNSTFDMGQSVARYGAFEYRFTSTGEWWYHNKLNANQKGKITVQ